MLEHMRQDHNSNPPSFQRSRETTDDDDTDSEEVEALEALSYVERYPQGLNTKDISPGMRLTVESLVAAEIHVDSNRTDLLESRPSGRRRWKQVRRALVADGHAVNSIRKYKALLQLYAREIAERDDAGGSASISASTSGAMNSGSDEVIQSASDAAQHLTIAPSQVEPGPREDSATARNAAEIADTEETTPSARSGDALLSTEQRSRCVEIIDEILEFEDLEGDPTGQVMRYLQQRVSFDIAPYKKGIANLIAIRQRALTPVEINEHDADEGTVVDTQREADDRIADLPSYWRKRTLRIPHETSLEAQDKHIRFDDVVEQVVAVDAREPRFDDMSEPDFDDFDDRQDNPLLEDSSDERLITKRRKQGLTAKGNVDRTNSSSKMIETRPATTLKYRVESPNMMDERYHVFGKNWSAGRSSPPPSQETLRPIRPSRDFLLTEDEEDDDVDEIASAWALPARKQHSPFSAWEPAAPESMGRTESRMIVPATDDEND